MQTAFILDLVYAIGVALSPTPVIVVILMLFGSRGRWNALSFLLGWVFGLVILAVVTVVLVDAGVAFLESLTQHTRPSLQILLGVGLIALAVRQWMLPPPPPSEDWKRNWMASADTLFMRSSSKVTPLRAFALAIVMSALSPKNIMLMLALALVLDEEGAARNETALLFAVFILISSVTIGIPVLYALLQGDNAEQVLIRWKAWLIENTSRAGAVLLAILGMIIVGNGLVNLSVS